MRRLILKALHWAESKISPRPLPNDLNGVYQNLQELPDIDHSRLRAQEKQAYRTIEAGLTGLRTRITGNLPEAYYIKLLMEHLIEVLGADRIALMNIDRLLPQETLNGEYPLTLQIRHWATVLLINNLGRTLLEEGGSNYWAIDFGSPLNREYPEFSLVIQKLQGKSPTTLLAEARQEIAELRGQLQNGMDNQS